jgi:hypothetical protein
VCQLLGQWRATQRYMATVRNDEDELTRTIVALASQRPLRLSASRGAATEHRLFGSKDRVERIWRARWHRNSYD